ncbi:MAG: DUF1937 family protein [Proteobacteria bacterium]|nr:DUF1937 family protein [Pseudomonadota bacterium]
MQKGPYYLAIPYQGTDAEKKVRTELSLKAAAEFLRQGIYLFSPVLYVNEIAEEIGFTSLEKRRAIVMPYLLDFLKVSRGLVLMSIEGWQDSWGVQQELKFCQENHIPIYKMGGGQLSENLVNILATPWDPSEMSFW